MEYNSRLESAKAELDSYSAEQEAIASLYEQAKQNAAAEYDARQAELAAQAVKDKNQAAVDMKKTERNIDRTLASRGLAFSGENAQTSVDLALGLRSELAEIDKNAKTQSETWKREKASTLTDLDLQYAKQRADSAGKLAELKATLAQAESESGSDGETPKSISELMAALTENADGTANAANTAVTPKFKGLSNPEKLKAMLYYMAKKNAAAENTGDGADGTASALTPEISARDLAKQLVDYAGADGKISGYAQQEALQVLLDSLTSQHTLDETYYSELILNLQSMGYRPGFEDDVTIGTAEVQKASTTVYQEYYERYYKIYQIAGYDATTSDEKAGEGAVFQQLLYIYRNSKTKDSFEAAARGLGFWDELFDFYAIVEEQPNKYVLGSELTS